MQGIQYKLAGLAALLLVASACVRNQPDVIIITATFQASGEQPALVDPQAMTPVVQQTLFPDQSITNPTPDPTRIVMVDSGGDYVVQPGDTLSGIAAANGVSVDTLLRFNTIANPDSLEVGQVLMLPGAPSASSPDYKIVPDARLVRGPGSGAFDIAGFIAQQPGFIRTATDRVNNEFLTAAEVVNRVALEYSIDPRLLLALVEYKAGWLSNPLPVESLQAYPMGANDPLAAFDRSGLYRQLAWASDQLNAGYYGWKVRGLSTLEFGDGTRLMYAPGLNAGTVAIQYLLSLFNNYGSWQDQVSPQGLAATYNQYFGNPFTGVVEPLVAPGIPQPDLVLPFPQGETWFYTGGPHGGWGAGSAWAAVDFAPPDELPVSGGGCYVSEHYATAVASGVIARTDEGTAILDLDGDGDESTGWSILYLHMAEEGRIAAGTSVQVGDRIGRPSCEGGFSNGTHMHIARRYNGEWIPASCESCPLGSERPPFTMTGWTAVGLLNQEYQGYLVRGNDQRVAEQGRLDVDNRVSW